jgi:parallel beta-helix repeat protein
MQLFERFDGGHAVYVLFYRIMRLIVCKRCFDISEKLPHVRLGHALAFVFQLTCAICLSTSVVLGFEGFGSGTPGGENGTVVAVTNLRDSGSGSLRAAIGNNRRIVFKVSGTINLQSNISIRDRHNITIDGSTAPGAGITLQGRGIDVRNSHDIILSNLRIRNARDDGISIRYGSHNVVVDHCSVTDSVDGNIDITEGAHDVTVSWTILGHARSNWFNLQTRGSLLNHETQPSATNVSFHHNLWINNYQRSPEVSTGGLVDFRNNLVWDWGARATRFAEGGYGNVINNVYVKATNVKSNLDDAVVLQSDADPVHISGNIASFNVNGRSTAAAPYDVADVITDPAVDVEAIVRQGAGAFPRDSIDASLAGSE